MSPLILFVLWEFSKARQRNSCLTPVSPADRPGQSLCSFFSSCAHLTAQILKRTKVTLMVLMGGDEQIIIL